MSKKTHTPKRVRDRLYTTTPMVTTVKDPGDVVAMIPYVIGFTPAESLVVVALLGPRKRFGPCLRLDLAGSPELAAVQAGYLVGVISAHNFDQVILVAFSSDAGRAGAVMQALRRGLARRRVKVSEALRADGRRWWSYTCTDPSCCSPEGTPYDADSSRVAAEAVASGLQRAPDRDSLRVQFEPADAVERRAVADACDRQRYGLEASGRPRPAVRDVDRLVARHLTAPDAMPVADLATLLLAIQRVDARDAAWGLMNRINAESHFRLWCHVMRNAPDDLMAPAGGLAGFAAWLDGHGAYASHAVDRVEQVSPNYSMCRLLREILEATLSPDVWNTFPLQRDPAS